MTSNNILIRQEKPNDYPQVFLVHELAFDRTDEAKLVNSLRKSNRFIPELSLVAEINKEIIGHIVYTKIEIHQGEGCFKSIALAPLSVRPDFQKLGVGSTLIHTSLSLATELNYNSIIVLGHKHYYPKFGFTATERWGIKAPFDVPAGSLMGLELRPGALEHVSGTIKYAPEFSAV
ncbi:GNAT family N-acetyltransferase [Parapedobacter deserti]|uniref:GNAT family N-acetyltransferase n=1 Tax=Parapedobacter deserti TaxID=1912957 RepID=A0ABV7JQT5_9SPHI